MLAELRISGLGVIDDAIVEPAPGLTVVTGETGAGKTMVVTALGLVSGFRADSGRVRPGARRAVVEARFVPSGIASGHDGGAGDCGGGHGTGAGGGDGSGAGGAGGEGAGGAGASDGGDAASDTRVSVRFLADQAEAVGGDTDDDGSLLAVRSVSAEGRSRAHIGGRSVPVSALAGLAEPLVAVHGQAEAMTLLHPANQRAVLDRFAEAADDLARYRGLREEWLAVRDEIDDRLHRARERAQREQVLRVGLAEIEQVGPAPGEDTDLAADVRRLDDADALRSAAQGAVVALAGATDAAEVVDEPSASGLVQQAIHLLETASDQQLGERLGDLRSALAVLGDVAGDLTGYLDGLDADPARLETLLQRQAELKGLVRRYGEDVDAVLAWAEQAREELAGLDSSEEVIAALRARAEDLAGEVATAAAALTARRRAAADRLGAAATAELEHLAMGNAVLRVAVTEREAHDGARDALTVDGRLLAAGPDGIDAVEMLLTAHSGAPELPVAKGASGGELSRVMLALEVVLAGADTVGTLVFDEVDAGVGGRAATEIGRRLALLSATHQVIVVTHLAQVAAFADKHYVVDADADGTVGASAVRAVTGDDRTAELARMLGGTDGEVAQAHAADLLAAATGS